MPTQLEMIAAEAMKLAPQERANLADRLWLSVHSVQEVEAAWDAEVARRVEQIERGEVSCEPWDEVMTELRTKFG